MNEQLVAAVLTNAQQEAVAFFRALNVPASWFVGVPVETEAEGRPVGTVEVIALGADFVWSIRIEPDGATDTSEATVGEFVTGIDV